MASTGVPAATESQAGTRAKILPPKLFAGLLAVTVVSGLALPGAWLDHVALRIAGITLIAAGAALNLWSDRQLKRASTTVKPGALPTALVSTGVFRLTRNPMYLGMTAILAGAALVLGSLPGLACAAAFAVLVDRLYIVREEADLSTAFGVAYSAYRRGVRRWL
jgi:protein-S-isoprenylcysteine O-methyltransferase Ste14